MYRSRSTSFSAAALLLTAPLLLTGCGLGSGDSKKSDAAATSYDASNPSASQTPGGSSSTSTGSAPSSTTTSTTDSGGQSTADTSGKPSKEAVKSGLSDYYLKNGMPKVAADRFAGCMVDQGYDKLSAKTLNAMKDGQPSNLDPADTTAFTEVSGKCAPRSGIPTNLPLPS